MKQSLRFLVLAGICLLAFAVRSPAPLTYTPGEGWSYNKVGEDTGKWQRTRAKDQLEVAQEAFDKDDFNLALKAARRVVSQWPLSDYAPKAQYLEGRCYEAKKQDEKAFNAYQRIIESNPKVSNYDEILQRQYEIANRYLGGQWFKLWNYIPFFPNMEKTAEMYEKIVKNGPYSEVAPLAQLKIGTTREKQEEHRQAVKAYEVAADRYSDRTKVASDATYKVALAYLKQTKTSDYDRSIAQQAIAAFTDFITLFPNDPRVPGAKEFIAGLRTEAARGSFAVGQFYEKRNKWVGALVYYNDVLVQDANSSYAQIARVKIDALKQRVAEAAGEITPAPVPASAEAPGAPEADNPGESQPSQEQPAAAK